MFSVECYVYLPLSRIDKNIDFWRLKWANDLSRILDIFRPAGDLSHIFDVFFAARRRRRKISTFHGGNSLKSYFSAPAAGFKNGLIYFYFIYLFKNRCLTT